jgi:ribosomal protein S18 acetylase RimI-like enzyme
MNIRNYQEQDYEAIMQNLKQADMFDEVWDGKTNFSSLIHEDPTNILVAEVDGKVVGSVLIDQFGAELAFIYRLVVSEDYRRQGVGARLIDAAHDTLRARGTKEVALFADATNEKLIQYYRGKGYTEGKHKYKTMWRSL